eukprot:CAMPEP_0184858804 /NCGR_PEP_ID=MMETSP0580-20130426/3844_1 /TAXON_ID=1118495 /ORGANISM="Dactyliosolen fragilissimus" /LENGTH=626 /DNA_ID=CAMNT_0027355111 /DNA_START=221 /DNA_END=2101 /DNA_ORIENTATION=-
MIPDAFIFNGVQNESRNGVLINIFPTKLNSVPLSMVFDTDALIQHIKEQGVDAQLIPHQTVVTSHKNKRQSCHWLGALSSSDHRLAMEFLQDFKPSTVFSNLVQTTLSNIQQHDTSSGSGALAEHKHLNLSAGGICLHHRNGHDWHKHCHQWEHIPDGVWRKNCLNERGLPLYDLFIKRLPSNTHTSWVYYIGDEAPSTNMISDFKNYGLDLVHRETHNLLSNDDIASTVNFKHISLQTHRDLFTAVDYFTCAAIQSFIGNSVSTFSANQIALRNGMDSSWYNSRSIPLAGLFRVFNIPIVYTYTELSEELGKFMLKTSILSVRGTFGSQTNIHILYHGENDRDFLTWLHKYEVIVHKHEPTWLDDIELMRQHGNPRRSHLFLHKGNYIGTWQRIDIPLFINAEYCLLLDSDTVVHEKFSMHDFGLDITSGIAVSSEADEDSDIPWNLGVALFNVPMLRETYDGFLKFILSHVENPMFKNNVSDQGAYLQYYESNVKFLDKTFNVKPYWTKVSTFQKRKIVHFHGLKAHDILKLFMGYKQTSFPSSVWFLLRLVNTNKKHACLALHDFSIYIAKDSKNLRQYCRKVFEDVNMNTAHLKCFKFFQILASENAENVHSCKEKILDPLS